MAVPYSEEKKALNWTENLVPVLHVNFEMRHVVCSVLFIDLPYHFSYHLSMCQLIILFPRTRPIQSFLVFLFSPIVSDLEAHDGDQPMKSNPCG